VTPIVILARPQMGENIGAVARAMSNFGLSELRIAAPRDGWPNPKALEMSAGAEYIIESAKLFPDFKSAMADIHVAYATTARTRDMEKRVITPDVAMKETHESTSKIALVFGPERSGLDNEEVTWCDTLITIPTAPQNSSLNIAQSMVILGYEYFKQQNTTHPTRMLSDIAPREDLQGLLGQLETYLDQVYYFRVEQKKPLMWQNIQNMFLRSQLNPQEIRTLRGMFRSLWERKKD
jgi:tRNA/rRNA methyltransferase